MHALARHWLTALLLLLIALTQWGLWLGEGGQREVRLKRAELAGLEDRIATQQRALEQLSAEIEDFRRGLEMVEERARAQLGMVKPDEVFVQYGATTASAALQ